MRDKCENCLVATQVILSVSCITAGTTLIVLSHGIPSPMLFYGIITVMTGIPGFNVPLWAFAIPLA
jgi:hypothetical protein